jgi:hypothetical protein
MRAVTNNGYRTSECVRSNRPGASTSTRPGTYYCTRYVPDTVLVGNPVPYYVQYYVLQRRWHHARRATETRLFSKTYSEYLLLLVSRGSTVPPTGTLYRTVCTVGHNGIPNCSVTCDLLGQ